MSNLREYQNRIADIAKRSKAVLGWASTAQFMVRKMNLRFKHFLTMNGCVNNALMMVQRERHAHKMSFSPIF
ncbi:hypothetical protein [Escherichia coli]|uniref:hypothetical protein n=1 Tax=Escherichia coli TaxID=562 RepID=UPI000A19E70A|nr:hypothetical protein [Escherichia coli]